MNSGRKWLSFFTPNPRPRIESVCFLVILLFLVRWVFINTDFVTRSLDLVNVILGTAYNLNLSFPFQSDFPASSVLHSGLLYNVPGL